MPEEHDTIYFLLCSGKFHCDVFFKSVIFRPYIVEEEGTIAMLGR
jgi:hypothetical protein